MEKVSTHGLITGNMKGNGETTKCMERELLFGLMDASILENTLMTRNMVMVNFFGLMVGVTEVNGLMENKMEKELTSQVGVKRNMVNGKMGRESGGLVEVKDNKKSD